MSDQKMLQSIASTLENTLPSDWSTVVFYAELSEGAFSMEYFVKQAGGKSFIKCYDLPGIEKAQLMKDFMTLNKVISAERSSLKADKRWGSMTLILQSNGKFRVEYDYSDMTDKPYARKQAWKKRYLV